MASKPDDDVVAEPVAVVSKWRTLARQQSTKVVELADNIVLPKSERIARQISRNETIEMQTIALPKNEVAVRQISKCDTTEMQSVEVHLATNTDQSPAEQTTEYFPMFMIGISLTQVGNCAMIYGHERIDYTKRTDAFSDVLPFQIFIFFSFDEDVLSMKLGYDPSRRHEIWRFFTAMLVHTGWSHLCGNLVMQLILGVFLEIVHKWQRIAIIYLASGFGGSLCITALDNASYSVGASGAVMGLLFSHLATIILNWNEMERKFSRLFCVSLYIIYDVGTDVYRELYLELKLNISHAAHFGGAVTGFLVSIVVLKNFKKHPWEKTLQKLCVGMLLAFFIIIFAMNVILTDYYPSNEWNFDYKRTYYGEDSDDGDDYDSTTFYGDDYGFAESSTTLFDDD